MKTSRHPHGQLGVKQLLHAFRPEPEHKVFARFGVESVAQHEAVVFCAPARAGDKNRLAEKAMRAGELDGFLGRGQINFSQSVEQNGRAFASVQRGDAVAKSVFFFGKIVVYSRQFHADVAQKCFGNAAVFEVHLEARNARRGQGGALCFEVFEEK